ncbi:MAG: protein kinase [Acidobacteriota bacterium]
MSTVDPFVPGSTLLTYRLLERVGTSSVWRAEDTRTVKPVAIKVLAKQLPRDGAKRDALIRDVRLGGALFHTSLVNIIEISAAGDALVMVMDWFDGQPSSTLFRNKPADRATFFRLAYQLADVLKLLQMKNLIHGNIAGDSVLVAENGQVRLAGLNATNLMTKRESPSFYQQKGSDPRAVSYMAPEQIKGDALTPQSDIFSLGIVLYEIAIGRLPYIAASAPEIARKIVDEQPASPKAINPDVDGAVLGVMGRCLFKDPFKRQKDARSLLEDINKVDAEAASFASALAKAAITGIAAPKPADARSALLMVADIAKYDEMAAADPASAQRAAARMQQVLGESVYLFDGQIVDPFGAQLVAELPSVESALEAGRKGEFDFSLEQQGSGFIPVRLLLHAGDVETRDGKVVGPAVDKALNVLHHVEPLQLFLSEEFVKKGRGSVRLRDAGARGGVKLYTITPAEKPKPEIDTAALEAEERAADEAEAAAIAAAAAAAAKRKRMLIAVVAASVAAAVVTGMVIVRKPKRTGPVAAAVSTAPSGPPPASAEHPRSVLLQPFTMETTDPALQQRAETVRLGAIEMLRAFPEIRVVDALAPDASAFTATVRGDAAAPQLVPAGGPPVVLADASSGILSIVQWVDRELKLSHPTTGPPEAYNAFADAVTAMAAKNDAKAEASLRASIKADPSLLPAQLLAMRFFASKGKDADAVAAAKQVMALAPSNLDAARMTARAGLKSGDAGGAIAGYAAVLKREQSNVEALNTIGRYAVAANDAPRLNAVIARLASSPDAAAVHTPDLLLSAGRLDAAVERYYDAERATPNNAALALKIGRLAVLRHSKEMADREVKKLEQLKSDYGAHLLKAYLAAESGSRAEADAELKAAEALSQPGDDYWTSAAEVAAIGGNVGAALAALERAAQRKEPTAGYVLTNRLLASLLASEPRYLKVRETFAAQQNEIRAALANVAL